MFTPIEWVKVYLIPVCALLLLSFTIQSCSGDEVVVVQESEIEETPVPENPDTENLTPPDPGVSDAATAFEITAAMSAGFNIGNVFDNGIQEQTFSSVKGILDLYKTAGMKHVRVPVTWMQTFSSNIADSNGNINTNNARFQEIVQVIDYAISLDYYVIINTHHEFWLKDNYDGSSNYNDKFTTLWTGIANYFKDYSEKLIFEILNEPEHAFGHWNKSPYPNPNNSQALAYTRQIMEVGHAAIRATGGNNETRIIMVATNAQGNQNQIEEVYPTKASLPGDGEDEYLMIQVHSYDPWSFCGQTGRNSNYPGDTSIASTIKNVSAHAKLLNVPVNYGEWGVGRDANASERNTDLVRDYYKFFKTTTLEENMSFTVWDDRGWFGLVSNNGGTWSFTNNIVPYMMGN